MDNSSSSLKELSSIVIFKNNNFTRNIAYLDGTAIYLSGGGSPVEDKAKKETRSLLQVYIDNCHFEKNYGLNVAKGGAVTISGN